MADYFVYILSNKSRMLYVGITNDLERRIYEHKMKLVPGFTSRYGLTSLVYYESTGDVRAAIEREKEIKGWVRRKKTALIHLFNPEWKDLSAEWSGAPVILKERSD
jgi:putative endonuclease